MADERLPRWALERGAELMRRAEEEAVAELKAMLVEAATGGSPAASRERPADKPPKQPKAPASGRTGEARWLYAVAGPGRPALPGDLRGVRATAVRAIEANGLTALVSPVPLDEFGEEELKQNLNDLAWLEEVARAHQRVVDTAFERGVVVPLRICTIYESEERVRTLLEQDGPRFKELLDSVEGREEWSVKLFVEPEQLAVEAARRGGEPESETATSGAGGAYLARRKSDRATHEAADRLAGELAEEVHARLQDWATDAVVGRPQNPELSGHTGRMLLNGAYLVESERAERFGELVEELSGRYAELGGRLEITGPWPPYNFLAVDS